MFHYRSNRLEPRLKSRQHHLRARRVAPPPAALLADDSSGPQCDGPQLINNSKTTRKRRALNNFFFRVCGENWNWKAGAGIGAASRQADAGAAQPAAAAGERRTRIARNHRAVWGRGGEGGCCLRVDGALHGRRGKQRSRGGGAACAGAAQEAGSASGSGARAACPVGNCDTVCRGVVGRPPEGGERPVVAAGPSSGAERTGCRVDRARARLCIDEPRLSCTSPCRWHARGD